MTTITVEEFKTRFAKNFTFGTEIDQVSDTNIQNAINDAYCVFNNSLYPVASTENPVDIGLQALNYLVAHFLTLDMDTLQMGAQAIYLQSSRSVNGMSESLIIPDWIQNTDLMPYATTSWGLKFLTITRPYLIGVCYSIEGYTVP
jgi:hypothetical protein